mgnify:CR=1 FL=1
MAVLGGFGFAEDGFLYSVHPDPSWARRSWIPLDGAWKVRRGGRVREIRVPFPIGSELCGAEFPDRGRFLFSRSFELGPEAAGGSVILRIGACDYETEVEINGRRAGSHVGGYASFSVDLSGLVRPGVNGLVLRVRDSHSPFQVRGKQTFLRKPFLVWYSGISGPWQSVWLETAGPRRLERPRVRADFDVGMVRIEVRAAGEGAEPLRLSVDLESPGGETSRFEADPVDAPGEAGRAFRIQIPFEAVPGPRWSPETPTLHRLRYTLYEGDRVSDRVESYLGLRRIEARDGRILLNGKPIALRMALVQGYYPGGWYAPESADRYRDDILALKGMGFNGARIHQKIESPYFHYLADRLGLLTTFEMPSFYLPSRRAFRAFESELREVIERDAAHPSGIAWVLFNETWGIWGIYGRRSRTRAFVRSMVDLVRSLDPGRPVIDNSGWEHLDTDIVDIHHYLETAGFARAFYSALRRREPRSLRTVSVPGVIFFYIFNRIGREIRSVFLDEDSRKTCEGAPWLVSEYGGFGWYASADPGSVPDRIEAYTRDIAESGLFQGYCLTQLYDVGTETNGILDFHRKPKVPLERLRAVNGTPIRTGDRGKDGTT